VGITDPLVGCVCASARADAGDVKTQRGYYTTSGTNFLEEMKKIDPLERELCLRCPVGADCSTKDGLTSGLTLAELTAKPGFWRPDVTTDTFSPCAVGYATLDAHDLARARCCPVDPITNISICVRNGTTLQETDEQCQKEYAGTLCLVCASGYVKQSNSCIDCPMGASIGIAALPLIGMLLCLFCVLMAFLVCGRKATGRAKRASKWFGQAKVRSFLISA
jgi:hypothetical protein